MRVRVRPRFYVVLLMIVSVLGSLWLWRSFDKVADGLSPEYRTATYEDAEQARSESARVARLLGIATVPELSWESPVDCGLGSWVAKISTDSSYDDVQAKLVDGHLSGEDTRNAKEGFAYSVQPSDNKSSSIVQVAGPLLERRNC
jgi:hypothetical protein